MIEQPPIFSLSHAVRSIAHQSGMTHELDDVNALLGVSMMFCAMPGERDISRWPLYARDAFLAEGARALGLTIRPIHPPEAARGLDSAQEFEQHFDASYRPLIQRAIENGQPVLAWRGWEPPCDMLWGIITEPCAEGSGFRGRVFVGDSFPSGQGVNMGEKERVCEPCLLKRPAIQLYVVESSSNRLASDEILRVALTHASAVLNNEIGDRFGVVSGPRAYDEWQRAMAPTQAMESGNADPSGAQMAALAGSAVVSHESAVRFLTGHRTAAPIEWHSRLSTLERECQNIVMTLKPLGDADRAAGWLSMESGRAIVTAKIAAAREATQLMQTSLIGLA